MGQNVTSSNTPDEARELREFAETVRKWHYSVATHENRTISTCGALGGTIYDHSQNLFKAAIKAAYPDLDETDIYEVWVDCMESVAYCANYVKQENEYKQRLNEENEVH